MTQYENSMTIDWLRLTISGSQHWDGVAAWLGIEEYGPSDWVTGERYGRQCGLYICEGVSIWADDIPAPSVSLETGEIDSGADDLRSSKFSLDFSGGGLATWAKERGQSPLEILATAVEICGKDAIQIMRIDLAFDDHEGHLDLYKIRRYLKSELAVTRWEKFQWFEEDSIGVKNDDGEVIGKKRVKGMKGRTIYLGSRLSPSFARVYDKRAEMLAKMNHDDRRAALAGGDVPEHWVRFELELKREHATAVGWGMLEAENPVEYGLGVLRGKIDFKATSGDKRVRRRGAVRWWEHFTQSVAARPIRLPRPMITIERIKGWINASVAPSVALLKKAFNGMQWLEPLVAEGEKRLDKKRLALLNLRVSHITKGDAPPVYAHSF